MGGMIAQVFAATRPQRVRTLTSIMSTTGNPRPGIALGKARALRALLKRPPGNPTIEQAVEAERALSRGDDVRVARVRRIERAAHQADGEIAGSRGKARACWRAFVHGERLGVPRSES